MRRPHVVIDGRVLSLQQKGGISQLWACVIASAAWRGAVDATLLLHPGHEKNLHLREMGVLDGRDGVNVVLSQIPPSDNSKFDGPEFTKRRAASLGEAGVVADEVDAVLNTYYGECALPGVARYLVTALDFAHEDLPELAAKPSTPHVLRMKKIAFEQATEVSFISSASRQRFFAHYPAFPAQATRVIHLGHDDNDPQVHKVSGLILHVGTRGAYKNFTTAARALERTLIAHRGARLMIAGGEASDPDTTELMARFPGRVLPLVQPSDADIDLAMAAAHVYLSASRYEGFGIPLLNALRLGSVPVVSDIPVYKELAGDRAEFFDPLDPASIAAGLARGLKRAVPTGSRYMRTWNDVARDYVRWLA